MQLCSYYAVNYLYQIELGNSMLNFKATYI